MHEPSPMGSMKYGGTTNCQPKGFGELWVQNAEKYPTTVVLRMVQMASILAIRMTMVAILRFLRHRQVCLHNANHVNRDL